MALLWFQLENLTAFSPHQVVDWDETHQDIVQMGGAGRSARGNETQIRFYRMPDDTIDLTGGKQEGSTLAEKGKQLTVKYNTGVCFALGTASVHLPDGTEEGRRAKSFEYTGKFIHTHKDYVVRQWTEIARVKALTGNGAPWVTGKRTEEDGFFDQDPTTELSGVANATEKLLSDAGG